MPEPVYQRRWGVVFSERNLEGGGFRVDPIVFVEGGRFKGGTDQESYIRRYLTLESQPGLRTTTRISGQNITLVFWMVGAALNIVRRNTDVTNLQSA